MGLGLGLGCCCCVWLDDAFRRTPTSGSASTRLGPDWNVLSGDWQIVDNITLPSGQTYGVSTGIGQLLTASVAGSRLACLRNPSCRPISLWPAIGWGRPTISCLPMAPCSLLPALQWHAGGVLHRMENRQRRLCHDRRRHHLYSFGREHRGNGNQSRVLFLRRPNIGHPVHDYGAWVAGCVRYRLVALGQQFRFGSGQHAESDRDDDARRPGQPRNAGHQHQCYLSRPVHLLCNLPDWHSVFVRLNWSGQPRRQSEVHALRKLQRHVPGELTQRLHLGLDHNAERGGRWLRPVHAFGHDQPGLRLVAQPDADHVREITDSGGLNYAFSVTRPGKPNCTASDWGTIRNTDSDVTLIGSNWSSHCDFTGMVVALSSLYSP